MLNYSNLLNLQYMNVESSYSLSLLNISEFNLFHEIMNTFIFTYNLWSKGIRLNYSKLLKFFCVRFTNKICTNVACEVIVFFGLKRPSLFCVSGLVIFISKYNNITIHISEWWKINKIDKNQFTNGTLYKI